MITYTTKSGRTFSFEKVQLRTDELPALIVFITSDWVENQNRFIVIQDPDTLAWAPALSGEVTEEIELKALDYMSTFNENKDDILQKIGLLICEVAGHA